MNFFNKKVDVATESTSKPTWILLTEMNQIDEIISISNNKPVAIFKHSTRCGVSKMVLKQFENEYNLQDQMALYFLDLLNHRDISNEIAAKFNVEHQSPQLLLIKNGKAIYHVSHNQIDAISLKENL